MKTSVARFLEAAQDYIAWVDAIVSGETTTISLRALSIALSRLQVAALGLPSVSDLADDDAVDSVRQDSPEESERIREALAIRLPVSAYGLIFDPLDEDERVPVVATLDDDLRDIYGDLRDGMALANAGFYSDAVWHWRFGYFTHWGRHAAFAQTAIYQYLTENQDDE